MNVRTYEQISFSFGKYQGQLIGDVAVKNLGYLKWLDEKCELYGIQGDAVKFYLEQYRELNKYREIAQ